VEVNQQKDQRQQEGDIANFFDSRMGYLLPALCPLGSKGVSESWNYGIMGKRKALGMAHRLIKRGNNFR
jgi:hypothetical protein